MTLKSKDISNFRFEETLEEEKKMYIRPLYLKSHRFQKRSAQRVNDFREDFNKHILIRNEQQHIKPNGIERKNDDIVVKNTQNAQKKVNKRYKKRKSVICDKNLRFVNIIPESSNDHETKTSL